MDMVTVLFSSGFASFFAPSAAGFAVVAGLLPAAGLDVDTVLLLPEDADFFFAVSADLLYFFTSGALSSICETAFPHSRQNFSPALSCAPQFGHPAIVKLPCEFIFG